METNFWNGKNVVLLGGASLIGVHLANALAQLPINHLRVADDESAGKREYLNNLEDVEFLPYDLRDYALAVSATRNMDIVFDLAAAHGGRGYVSGHAVELWDNLSLSSTIFRACAKNNVEKVIFSSSACAYPVNIQQDINQILYLNERMIDYKNIQQADGAYGTEKLISEIMLDAYIEAGRFKGCSTRSYTVYGALMKESHAICALIAKAMLKLDPYPVWGDGNQIRNWTHVTDNVAGAILAAENLDRGAINIGVEDRLTPRMAMDEIFKCFDWWPTAVHFQVDKPVGPPNRVSDSRQLRALGWTPKMSFSDGIRATVDWYLATHNVEDVRKNLERSLTER